MDIKQLARQRIAEAEAAIAAAGKSAMSTYQAEGFRSDNLANPVPWTAIHERNLSQPAQFPTSFAERLKLHEAHLNALKQASKKPPLPSHSLAPASQPRTFSSLSDPSSSYLPPWSQPHHMPTFRCTAQSDPSLPSVKSFEGSRVSTAGSAATIGWAGPWVVTHRQNGPDRMYPANLRPNVQSECLPSYLSNGSAAKENALMYAPLDHKTAGSSKKADPQPVPVEWMLPGHAQATLLAHSSAAGTAPRMSRSYQSKTTVASAARRAQGIPSAPAAGSPAGASWQVPGSQIPSPVRKGSQQQSQHRSLHRTGHDGNSANVASGHNKFDGLAADASEDVLGRGLRVRPPANDSPPFPNAAMRRGETVRRIADGPAFRRQHARECDETCAQLDDNQRRLGNLSDGQHNARLVQQSADPHGLVEAGRGATRTTVHATGNLHVPHRAVGSAPCEDGASCERGGSGTTRSRGDTAAEPCRDGQGGPQERHAALSAPMARLKRLLRTRSSDSSSALATVAERPPMSIAVDGQCGQPHGRAGSLKKGAPRVLQQSPTKLKAQSSLRKLEGRQAAGQGDASARMRHGRKAEGPVDEQPAVAQSSHVDFEAMVEQKMREEAAAAASVEGRQECHSCGRRFAQAALAKHEAVCAKAVASKRAPMDMRRKRLAGVVDDGGAAVRRKGGMKRGAARPGGGPVCRQAGPERPVAAGASSGQAWKRKSDAFRAAMRANRQVNAAQMRGEDITKLPVFKDEHDDRVPCPHCGRKFAPLTAERHIPKCKDIRAKPAFLKRGSGVAGGKGSRCKLR